MSACRAAMARRALMAAAVVLALPACDGTSCVQIVNLERMIDQKRADPYGASPFFSDGRVMQHPPKGTVAREELTLDPLVTQGLANGVPAAHIPVPVTRALLERGREQFDTFCAACHGPLGNGESVAADFMTVRKPPSLIDPPIADYPPGRIYQVIREGFGMMPSYGYLLPVEDRWAVTAYWKALALSQGVELMRLPPQFRSRAEEELQ